MQINIQSISRREGQWLKIDADISAESMPLDFEGYALIGPIRLSGYLLNAGDDTYRLSGKVETDFRGSCARCLKPVQDHAVGKVDDAFVLAGPEDSHRAEPTSEDGDDDAMQYAYHGLRIDLHQALRDDLVLALPPRLLCRQDCKGLCPSCGQDLNEKTCDCTDEAPQDPSPFDRLKELL